MESALQATVCISDDRQWLQGVADRASSAGVARPKVCSWHQFDATPMELADPRCFAYAHIEDAQGVLDVRLGNLCRAFPYGVLLELADGVWADDQRFFAHGFQKFDQVVENETIVGFGLDGSAGAERCFQFRLKDYKAVPDWLNARFWAHPERFHL